MYVIFRNAKVREIIALHLPGNSLPTAETQLRIFLLICAFPQKRHVKSDKNEWSYMQRFRIQLLISRT